MITNCLLFLGKATKILSNNITTEGLLKHPTPLYVNEAAKFSGIYARSGGEAMRTLFD
jgi:hypothetical protein